MLHHWKWHVIITDLAISLVFTATWVIRLRNSTLSTRPFSLGGTCGLDMALKFEGVLFVPVLIFFLHKTHLAWGPDLITTQTMNPINKPEACHSGVD